MQSDYAVTQSFICYSITSFRIILIVIRKTKQKTTVKKRFKILNGFVCSIISAKCILPFCSPIDCLRRHGHSYLFRGYHKGKKTILSDKPVILRAKDKI